MKVLGIYGSPRQGGNSVALLDKALEGAESSGAEVKRIYVCKMKIQGCLECSNCDNTGQCTVQDDMQAVYPLLEEAEVIFLGSPVFFYGLPAQTKALIDRCQALWNKRRLEKTQEQRKVYNSGKGYLISVGATMGENLFQCSQLTARYFYDALDKSYEGGLFLRGIDSKGSVNQHPEALKQAFELGASILGGRK